MRVYYIDPKRKRDYNEYNTDETVEKFNKGYFRLVADTCADNLEDAYRMTQNMEHSWVTNKYVVSYATKVEETRSSMVGDVICKGDGINREFFKVSSCGFEKLEGIDV